MNKPKIKYETIRKNKTLDEFTEDDKDENED